MQLPMLLGGAVGLPVLNDHTILDAAAGRTCTAEYFLRNTGVAERLTNVTTTPYAGEWLPVGDPAAWDVRCTKVSGDTPTGSASDGVTWMNLGTDRSWRFSGAPLTILSCQLLIEISPAGAATVVESATIDLEVNAEF